MFTKLFTLLREESVAKSDYLSDDEIEDLDINRFFLDISSCITPWGQQYFYSSLCSRKIKREFLSLDMGRFSAIKKILSKHRQERNYDLIEFIKKPEKYTSYLNKKRTGLFSILLSNNLVFAALGAFVHPSFWVLFALVSFVNSTLHFINKYEQMNLISALKNIDSLWQCLKDLEKNNISQQCLSKKISLGSMAFLLKLELKNPFANELSVIQFYIIEFIKSIFLLDYFLALTLIRKLDFHDLHSAYIHCALHDFTVFKSEKRFSLDNECIFKNDVPFTLDVEDIIHPQVPNAVGNTISINKNIVLNGSNASGKSTFLRSLAINSLLAHSIGYTYSKSWTSSRFYVHCILNKKDNTLSGLSLFQSEVRRLELLIKNIEGTINCNHLVILDEILSGTNDLEKNIIIHSLTKYLSGYSNIRLIVCTHDMGLANDLVELNFAPYHFNHGSFEKKMEFKYKLLQGLSKSTNAIDLFKTHSFPDNLLEIIENHIGGIKNQNI